MAKTLQFIVFLDLFSLATIDAFTIDANIFYIDKWQPIVVQEVPKRIYP